MGDVAKAVLAIGALITAIMSAGAYYTVQWANAQYATVDYVQNEFSTIRASGYETKQGLYFLTSLVLAAEISRLNREVSRLESEVDGNLTMLSPSQQNYYNLLQEQLREARRRKEGADQRLHSLSPAK